MCVHLSERNIKPPGYLWRRLNLWLCSYDAFGTALNSQYWHIAPSHQEIPAALQYLHQQLGDFEFRSIIYALPVRYSPNQRRAQFYLFSFSVRSVIFSLIVYFVSCVNYRSGGNPVKPGNEFSARTNRITCTGRPCFSACAICAACSGEGMPSCSH